MRFPNAHVLSSVSVALTDVCPSQAVNHIQANCSQKFAAFSLDDVLLFPLFAQTQHKKKPVKLGCKLLTTFKTEPHLLCLESIIKP